MKTTHLTLFVLILLGLIACSQAIPTTTPPLTSSGIEVFVTVGPVCPGPVVEGDVSCQDKPYQADITILDSGQKLIMQFQTDVNGYSKIALNPGTYIIHPESGKPLPGAADQTVVVADGVYSQVFIQYDSGIR